MSKIIDCLFIGHNEMNFERYEQMVRTMGVSSGSYRDLNMSFIKDKDRLYTVPDILNEFLSSQSDTEHFNLGESISLTIAYLCTYIKRKGFSYEYVNSFQDEKEELIKKLKEWDIKLIAIPTTLYVSAAPILEIISLVKEYNKTAKIIIGGPFVATQIRLCKEEEMLKFFVRSLNADIYINNSQGETALANVLYAIKNNLSFENIENIIYKVNDEYIINPEAEENNKLEENIVDWSLFSKSIGKTVMLRTSISCPFRCSFCGFPLHAGKYQTADLKVVEQELNEIDSIGTVSSVQFIDDTFNVPKERFKEILRMMIRNKYKFKWNSHFRCQFADRETIELMKESGCEGVFLGIESGSQKILKNMNKSVAIDDYKRGIALLREYDIITYASFIIGFPGETDETVNETIDFIKANEPTFFRTQLWYCDPITPIWEQKEKYNLKGSNFNWSHATMDSIQACDWIDKIFASDFKSVWIPQYNFEFEGIFSMLHRGMSLEQVKMFITAFNAGVAEKMDIPEQNGISYSVLDRMRDACCAEQECNNIAEKYEAEFDF